MKRVIWISAAYFTIGVCQFAQGQSIEHISVYWQLGVCRDLEVSGHYAYLACDTIGLAILNIEDLYEPFEVGRLYVGNSPVGIGKFGNYICLLDEMEGMYIIDISEPSQPFLVASCNPSRFNYEGLFVNENYAFIRADSVYIVNLADPFNPMVVGGFESDIGNYSLVSVFVSGDYAYLPGGYCRTFPEPNCAGAVRIFRISNPAAPVLVGTYNCDLPVNDVFASGDYAFLATGGRALMQDRGGMLIINISDPANPVFVSSFDYQSELIYYDIFYKNGYVFSGYGVNKIIDLDDSFIPVSWINIDSAYTIFNMYVDDSYYIYTAGFPAFQIMRFNPVGISSEENSPAIYSLSQNYPNPFNAKTTIHYSLPKESDVRIDIYDITGRMVETLFDGMQTSGEHIAIWNATDRSSGIYFYHLKSGNYSKTEKCILLK